MPVCVCMCQNTYNASYRCTRLYITEGYKKKDKEDAQSLSNSDSAFVTALQWELGQANCNTI